MKKIILNYKEALIVFICLFVIMAASLASGYFLDPTVLGFFLTPLFYIVFGFASVIFSGISIFRLFKVENRKKLQLINALACTLFMTFHFAGLLPNTANGVQYRLNQFSKSDFQEISYKVELAYEKFGKESKFFSRDDEGYEQFLDQLKKDHRIFNISSFPVDVFRRESSIHIEWASGLTGGYEVIIYDGLNLPHWAEKLKVVHIYENVAFYYKS